MLTGDARKVGESVARELGIDEAITPNFFRRTRWPVWNACWQKSATMKNWPLSGTASTTLPCWAGPTWASPWARWVQDAAIEAADVVLMDDRPTRIADAMRIARKTLRIVRQNIVFALGVKGVVLALGAAGLANMWAAVFADVGVSVIAILNAMRALDVRKK